MYNSVGKRLIISTKSRHLLVCHSMILILSMMGTRMYRPVLSNWSVRDWFPHSWSMTCAALLVVEEEDLVRMDVSAISRSVAARFQ